MVISMIRTIRKIYIAIAMIFLAVIISNANALIRTSYPSEAGPETLTVIPPCTGNIDFTIEPNSIGPGGSVNFIASGLTNCKGKTVTIQNTKQPGVVLLSPITVASCPISTDGTGCPAPYTISSTATLGDYTYRALIDRDGLNGVSSSGEISGEQTLTVVECSTTPPKSEPPISLANGCAVTVYAKGEDGPGTTIVGEGKYKDLQNGAAYIYVNYDDYKNDCDVDFKFNDSWSASGNSLTMDRKSTRLNS